MGSPFLTGISSMWTPGVLGGFDWEEVWQRWHLISRYSLAQTKDSEKDVHSTILHTPVNKDSREHFPVFIRTET